MNEIPQNSSNDQSRILRNQEYAKGELQVLQNSQNRTTLSAVEIIRDTFEEYDKRIYPHSQLIKHRTRNDIS